MKRTLFFSLLPPGVALRTVVLLAAALLASSCRPASVIPDEGDDPDIPSPGDEKTVSVAYLKTLYKGAPVRITGELHIAGAVVSDDRQGNFYKTLVVDDGSGGIEVKLDMEQIFKRFMIHTRAGIRCNGLWLGSYGGTLQLGAEPFENYETQFLDEEAIAEHVRSDNEFYGEVKARLLTFSELAVRYISTFVAFDGVQFAEKEQGFSWADTEAGTDTDRHLVDASGDTLAVRTSRFARFAAWPLPEGSGRIEGVLGYFNGKYQLVVCDAQKAEMEGPRF